MNKMGSRSNINSLKPELLFADVNTINWSHCKSKQTHREWKIYILEFERKLCYDYLFLSKNSIYFTLAATGGTWIYRIHEYLMEKSINTDKALTFFRPQSQNISPNDSYLNANVVLKQINYFLNWKITIIFAR